MLQPCCAATATFEGTRIVPASLNASTNPTAAALEQLAMA